MIRKRTTRNHLLTLLHFSPAAIDTRLEPTENNTCHDNQLKKEEKEKDEELACFKELTLLRCKERGRRRYGKTREEDGEENLKRRNSTLYIKSHYTTNKIIMTVLSIQIFILFFFTSFKLNGE